MMNTQLTVNEVRAVPQYALHSATDKTTQRDQANLVVRLVVSASLYTLAALALVVLRAVGQIDWAWLTVTAPLWMPSLLALALILLYRVTSFVAQVIRR